jgi:hypothetical protein
MTTADNGNGWDLTAVATFAQVDRRADLLARPRRAPDHAATERVLSLLADEMATNPGNMLQTFAEQALALCRADTAGISLLDGDVFRWEALAGVVADKRHETMPRDAIGRSRSPNGSAHSSPASSTMPSTWPA